MLRAPARPKAGARALYVYAILRAERPLRFEAIGLDERWPVHTIHYGGLAAVVSEVPFEAPDPTRDQLLAHERVNAEVLREHTLIPMSFGTVFRSGEDVIALLRAAHDTFADVLAQLHGSIEFGLKVFWDRDGMIRAIEDGDEELRRLRSEILSQPGAAFVPRMEYGQRVDAALAQRSQQIVAQLLQRLHDVCVASRCNRTFGERMILNAAFLVRRAREAAFDQRLRAIADGFDGLTFQYTGPWPPYNFVAIRLKREGRG